MCLTIFPPIFSSVQSLSRVWLFVTPWTAAPQASLSITNSWSLPKLMSIELVMPWSHLILCRPLLLLPQSLPASESFPMSQLFTSGGQSIGVSALASVLPMNTQGSYISSFWNADANASLGLHGQSSHRRDSFPQASFLSFYTIVERKEVRFTGFLCFISPTPSSLPCNHQSALGMSLTVFFLVLLFRFDT